jgi:alpha-tubulin suppressor-like RCC1 family protein
MYPARPPAPYPLMRRHLCARPTVVALVCSTVIAACVDRDAATGPMVAAVRPSEVIVSPRLDTIFVRDTIAPNDRLQLRALVLGFAGAPLPVGDIRWSTPDTSLVRVDSLTGLVVPLPRRQGTATVKATVGGKDGTATVVVTYAAVRLTIQPRALTVPGPGQAVRSADTIFVRDPITPQNATSLRVLAIGTAGETLAGIRYVWTSADPAIATVDSAGNVLARSIGTTTIAVRGAGMEASRPLTVASVVRELGISAPSTRVLTDDTLRLTAAVTGRDSLPLADPRVRWSSSNTQIATIDSVTGLARFLTRGTVRFTARSHFVTATTSTVGNVENIEVLDRIFLTADVGLDHTCSTIQLGRVYCWGRNAERQLGAPSDSVCFDTSPSSSPLPCSLLPERTGTTLTFARVTAGDSTSCGVSTSGRAYCWGQGTLGRLGNGTNASSPAPNLVTSALVFDSTTAGLSVGGQHVCGIAAGARLVYCWGDDTFGQLGTQAVTVNSTTPIPADITPFPSGPAQVQWVSAGYRHTCAVSTSGQAYCWGGNASGELGLGTRGGPVELPTAIGEGVVFRTISASTIAQSPTGRDRVADDGEAHTCGLRGDGRALCWGANLSGQTGGSSGARYVTTPAPVDAPVAFTQISAGGAFTCALGTDRAIYCWGRNDVGQLGQGTVGGPFGAPLPIATPVASDQEGRIAPVGGPVAFVSVSAGRRHACALAVDGQLYCWGSDVLGALGSQLQARVQPRPMRVANPL